MVYNNMLSRVFTAIGDTPRVTDNKGIPMLNSVMSDFSSFLSATGQIRKKKALMAKYYSIPELTGLANKVARDIISDYEFVPIRKGERGRADKKKAEEFAEKHFLDRTRFSQVIDCLITGEGFGWMKHPPKQKVKEIVDAALKHHVGKLSFKERSDFSAMIEKKIDEDLRTPREYLSIASSTMEVRHDQYDITEYTQQVNARRKPFNTKEIIRFNLMDVDGRVNGFTPMESMLVQLEILREMWANQLALQKNGGSPDRIIVAKNLQPNSVSYQKIKEQLMKYKQVQNRHGNMLFTGDIDVKTLEQMDQMQFKDSGLYITGIMALQWSVPRSSIPMIVGGSNTSDDTGGNSERDYWNNVEFTQQLWANFENSQMWIPKFNVRIKFNRKFKQSMIQEETYKQLKYNNVKLFNDMLRQNGKTLNNEKMMELFDICEGDLEDVEMDEMMLGEEGSPKSTLNDQLSKRDRDDGDDKKNKNMRKRDEQMAVMSTQGRPTGVGKEEVVKTESKELQFKSWDNSSDLEFKQLLSGNLMKLDFADFVKIYNEDKQMGVEPPRLFVKMKPDFINFNFKSTDYSYTTTLTTEEFNTDSTQILMMNLKGNLYNV